jgi:BirA family biotin operon repressor/biotin-[acetyl-CoA-carboxylase] ligase
MGARVSAGAHYGSTVGSPYADLERAPLRAGTLERALIRPESMWREVVLLGETESTNGVALDRAAQGAPEGLVVVAEHQSAGRGRLDRTWVSPPRAGLTFSLLLRPAEVLEATLGWLPLLAGLAFAEGIDHVAELPGPRVELKWPNDLLIDGGKLGGLLAERRQGCVVVGAGVNVTTRPDELPTDEAVSLAVAGAGVTDRETLLRACLRAFESRYLDWCERHGAIEELLAAYVERCATVGAAVTVTLPGERTLGGRATGVDTDGRLLVATPDGEVTAVGSGDVVHVRRTQ